MIVLLVVLLMLLAAAGVVIIVQAFLLREAKSELEKLRPIAPAPEAAARATLLSVLNPDRS